MNPNKLRLVNHYVYVWFTYDHKPYYVGHGNTNRWTWLKSKALKGEYCLIILHALTKITANSYEQELIKHLANEKHQLMNQVHNNVGKYTASSELLEAYYKAVKEHKELNND